MPMIIETDEFVDYYYSKGWGKNTTGKPPSATGSGTTTNNRTARPQPALLGSQRAATNAPGKGTDSRIETLRKLWNQYDQEEQEAAKKEC